MIAVLHAMAIAHASGGKGAKYDYKYDYKYDNNGAAWVGAIMFFLIIWCVLYICLAERWCGDDCRVTSQERLDPRATRATRATRTSVLFVPVPSPPPHAGPGGPVEYKYTPGQIDFRDQDTDYTIIQRCNGAITLHGKRPRYNESNYHLFADNITQFQYCLLYTSPSPRD